MEGSPGRGVTLCIPSYNRAELIVETLDSICAQTYPDWEALVVDDGSTDASLSIIRSYAAREPRIRLMMRNREPKGAGTCRNIGVTTGRGKYVLFLDTDDVLAPFCLEQRVRVMEADPDLDFAIFPMLLFDRRTEEADRLWNVETGVDDLVRLLRLDPVCPGTGTLWRRDSFIRVGMWAEGLSMWQDIDLHLRAFTGGYRFTKHLHLRPDVYLRETDASLSRGSYHSDEKLAARRAVARSAVALLREAGKPQLLPEVRYLTSSVILGAASAGKLDIAREMRSWAVEQGVLTRAEALRFRAIELLRVTKLDRVGVARKIRDALASAFSVESNLGKVRVEPSHG